MDGPSIQEQRYAENTGRPRGIKGLDETIEAIEDLEAEFGSDAIASAAWWLSDLRQRCLDLMADEAGVQTLAQKVTSRSAPW